MVGFNVLNSTVRGATHEDAMSAAGLEVSASMHRAILYQKLIGLGPVTTIIAYLNADTAVRAVVDF